MKVLCDFLNFDMQTYKTYKKLANIYKHISY